MTPGAAPRVMAVLAMTLAVLAPARASAPPVPHVPITLTGLDLHDGTIVQHAGRYLMYGTRYGCGFSWGTPGTPFCGFGVASASSLAGLQGAPVRPLFPPGRVIRAAGWHGDDGKTWQQVCSDHGAGCFNPRMVLSPGGRWLLWFNAPADWWFRHEDAYWVMTCSSASGPCYRPRKPALAQCGAGDFSIATAGKSAWIVCARRYIAVQRLDPAWTSGTGTGQVTDIATGPASIADASTGITGSEGDGAYLASPRHWVLTYSDPQCGYCSGTASAAGPVSVHAAYATASTPLGHWTVRGFLSPAACAGQPRTVFTAGGQAYEWVDRWLGTRNETQADVLLEPMTASPWSCA
jgi:hypothetical protein